MFQSEKPLQHYTGVCVSGAKDRNLPSSSRKRHGEKPITSSIRTLQFKLVSFGNEDIHDGAGHIQIGTDMQMQKVKDQAFGLMNFLRKEGIKLDHGRSLDVVSHVFYGKHDWNTLCASLAEEYPEATPLHQQLMKAAIAREEAGWKEELARSGGGALSGKVVAVGRLDGTLVSVGYGPAVADLAMTSALFGATPTEEHVVIAFSLLVDKDGNVGAGGLTVRSWETEINRTVVLQRWYNNTASRGTCPLTGEVFKPSIGLQYFLGDSASPVVPELVPGRLNRAFATDADDEVNAPCRSFVVSTLELMDAYAQREELTDGRGATDLSRLPVSHPDVSDEDAPF
jgi:hypothetical protein